MLPASDHFVRVAYAEIGENALEKIGFHKASSQRIDSFPLMLHNGKFQWFFNPQGCAGAELKDVLVSDKIYTTSEATKKFLSVQQ